MKKYEPNQIYKVKYVHITILFDQLCTMKSHFDIEFLEQATEKLKAIAHPIRFVIVEMLSRENELSVTDIHEKLDIEQAVASHHLRILKNQNVVKVSRDGKNSFYSLTSTSFSQIIDNMIAAG